LEEGAALGTERLGPEEVEGAPGDDEREGESTECDLDGAEERVEGPLLVRLERVVLGAWGEVDGPVEGDERREGLRVLGELGEREEGVLSKEPLSRERVVRPSDRDDRSARSDSTVLLPDRPSKVPDCLLGLRVGLGLDASNLVRCVCTDGAAKPMALPRLLLSGLADFIFVEVSFDFLMASGLEYASAFGSPLERVLGASALFTPASSREGAAGFRTVPLLGCASW
jgi:hypothetical protein